jgi:hypothetical protein
MKKIFDRKNTAKFMENVIIQLLNVRLFRSNKMIIRNGLPFKNLLTIKITMNSHPQDTTPDQAQEKNCKKTIIHLQECLMKFQAQVQK